MSPPVDLDPAAVGLRLSRLRAQGAGISQESMATRVGVTRNTIMSWENGKTLPTLDKLWLLADVFGVPIDEMVGRASPRIDDATLAETVAHSVQAARDAGRRGSSTPPTA